MYTTTGGSSGSCTELHQIPETPAVNNIMCSAERRGYVGLTRILAYGRYVCVGQYVLQKCLNMFEVIKKLSDMC